MISSVDGSSSSREMLPPTRGSESSGLLNAWHRSRKGSGARRFSKRIHLIISGIVLLSVLTAMITWAATSIGPAPRVAVTLVSTDYCNNLNLPPNGYGDRAVGRLASWVTGGPVGLRRNIRLLTAPIALSTKADLSRLQADTQAAVSITFVSAHGLSTDLGAAILPSDAESSKDAYLVSDLVEQIAKFPADQKKFLLLDCAHFATNEPFGVLLNDFARQMRELNDVVLQVPNLVVLISADVNQQSWIDPASGTTAWSDAIIKALNGNADDTNGDGWIDMYEVHVSALQATQHWVDAACRQSQTAFMLPAGLESTRRCQLTGLYPITSEGVDIPNLASKVRGDVLESWWKQHQFYASQLPSPIVRHPVTWRRFEQTLLRFEHFELAGCRTAADTLAAQLDDLAVTLAVPTRIESVTCHSGVVSPEAVGFVAPSQLDLVAKQLASLLPELPINEAAEHWLGVVAEQPNAASIAYLRRAVIEQQIRRVTRAFRDEVDVDRDLLSRTATLIRAISDPLHPVTQVGQVAQLIAHDLPSAPLQSRDATNIARFLELTVRSDRVSSGSIWWAPVEFRWVQRLVVSADQNRRLAGDLLMGDADARRRSESYLTNSEREYQQIDEIAGCVRKAERALAHGPYDLQKAVKLIAIRSTCENGDSLPQYLEDVESLYRDLDRIEARLAGAILEDDEKRDLFLDDLDSITQRYQNNCSCLLAKLNSWQAGVFVGSDLNAPDVYAAMSLVGGSSRDRQRCWERLIRLAASDHSQSAAGDQQGLADHDRRSGAFADTQDFQIDPKRPLVSASVRLKRAKSGAVVRGQLAISPWSSSRFDQLVSRDYETKQQVSHRIEIFSTESEWWDSLAEVGRQINARSLALKSVLNQPSTVEFGTVESSAVEFGSRKLDFLRRMADVPNGDLEVLVADQFRKAIAPFFHWQSERFTADAYWSLRQEGPAYFARIRDLIDSDLAAIGFQSAEVTNASASPGNELISIRTLKNLVWTTQQEDQLDVRVMPSHLNESGFAAMWLEASGDIRPTHPQPNARVCRPLSMKTSAQNPIDPANADGLLVKLRHEKTNSSEPNRIRVHAYYRGRSLFQDIPIQTLEHPDVHIVQNPVPKGGRIAVRNQSSPTRALNGAVTILLDCSGSMGAARGESFGPDAKYAQAFNAVKTLVDDLPSGIRLSIWAFGQAVGESKTAHPAERSIHRIQEPIAWDPRDPSMRDNLMDAISYPNLEPWNQSPLVAAMVAASDDLKNFDGVRSMVVITDGADNCIGKDSVTNPLGLTAEELITKHFNASGITVNVIAFRVDAEEQNATRAQLKTVERLIPAGRFVETEQTSELATALAAMLSVDALAVIQPAEETTGTAEMRAAKVAISPSRAAPSWSETLPAGLYRVKTQDSASDTLVQLRDGDRLALAQSSAGVLALWPGIQTKYAWCQKRQSGRWNMALVPDPSSTSSTMRRDLVMSAPNAGGALAVARPGEMWIESCNNDGLLPLRMLNRAESTELTRELLVRRRTRDRIDLKLWISDRPADPCGVLIRDRDFLHFEDLAPAKWHLSDGVVHLHSARIEIHSVADRSGNVKDQPCLVIRGACPQGSFFRLRTVGVPYAGQDEQCFASAGRFTLRQWPVTREVVEQTIKRLELVAVKQFKNDALRSGGYVLLNEESSLQDQATSQSLTNTVGRSVQ